MGRHDDEKLRRFLVARRSGDAAVARRWWDELAAGNFDRVVAMVALESRGRLSPEERDEAVQRALVRILNNLCQTFEGGSVGEYVMAVRRLVTFACIDTQRRATTVSRRERSLDERRAGAGDDDARPGRFDAAVHRAAEAQRRADDSAAHDAEALIDARGFLDWAVPQLAPQRRAVIELVRQDVEVEDIQRRLGVSRDVVYASRSRALKDLVALRDRYPEEQP